MNEENKQSGSLLSGQEPHQKEEMDQASRASAAAFNLEVEKGISPDPEQYNQGEESGNIRQAHPDSGIEGNDVTVEGTVSFDQARDNPDLDAGVYDVTSEDLKNLDAMEDIDDDEEFPGHS